MVVRATTQFCHVNFGDKIVMDMNLLRFQSLDQHNLKISDQRKI